MFKNSSQKKVLGIMPLYQTSKILKIYDLYKYSLLCFIFKNYNLISSNVPSHDYQTRNDFLVPIFQRIKICQRSIFYTGIKFWNETPDSLKQIDDYVKFKMNLKSHLIGSYFSNQ